MNWEDKLYEGTKHMNLIIEKFYNLYGNDGQFLKECKKNYPFGCIIHNLSEIYTENDANKKYILESIHFQYNDLEIFEKYDNTKNYIESHASKYIKRFQSILNSKIFNMDDILLLTNRSGLRNIKLNGTFEYNDTLKLYHNHNKESMIENNSKCYWVSYPYSELLCPSVTDFETRLYDINIIFFSENNWIPIIIFVKLFNTDELEDELQKYINKLENFINTDQTYTHFYDNIEFEHSILEKYGLKIFFANYNNLINKLEYISDAFSIPLTQKKKEIIMNFNIEKLNKPYQHKKSPYDIGDEENNEIKLESESKIEDKIEDKNENENDDELNENELNEFLDQCVSDKSYLDFLNETQSVYKKIYTFLNTDSFNELYKDKYGYDFENKFDILIDNFYYKELLYSNQYRLSTTDFIRLKDHVELFKKGDDNHYYRELTEDELNVLISKNDFNNDEYKILKKYNKINNIRYDVSSRLYYFE